MTTSPQDWMRSPAAHGGGPGQGPYDSGPALPGAAQPPYGQPQQPYGQQGPQQNPYATGPGPEAVAHYDPAAPRVPNRSGAPTRRRPGLQTLAVLLVLGSLAFVVWHFATWGSAIVDATQLENCPTPDQRMNCLATDSIHRWVYAPLLAVIVSWAFASGASVEAKQGRARGYLHLLAGIAALAIVWVVSGS